MGYGRNEPDPIALCLEVNGEVERKGKIRSGLIRKGDYIYHGDKLITNNMGFASIMMIYEDTYIRIYDNSAARVLFDKEKKSKNSELLLFVGKVIIEMGKSCDHYFILNTKLFSESANTWDSLGEFYEKEGSADKAKRAYIKAVTVAKNNFHTDLSSFEKHLKKINDKILKRIK